MAILTGWAQCKFAVFRLSDLLVCFSGILWESLCPAGSGEMERGRPKLVLPAPLRKGSRLPAQTV